MYPPAYYLQLNYFCRYTSKPAKSETKYFLGATVLLLSLLALGSPALAQMPLAPSALAFGNQVINQPSAALGATLRNAQAEPLTIRSIAISGGNAASDYILG